MKFTAIKIAITAISLSETITAVFQPCQLTSNTSLPSYNNLSSITRIPVPGSPNLAIVVSTRFGEILFKDTNIIIFQALATICSVANTGQWYTETYIGYHGPMVFVLRSEGAIGGLTYRDVCNVVLGIAMNLAPEAPYHARSFVVVDGLERRANGILKFGPLSAADDAVSTT